LPDFSSVVGDENDFRVLDRLALSSDAGLRAEQRHAQACRIFIGDA
jgi:hypothetical protein